MIQQQMILDAWVLPALRELLPDMAVDAWAGTVSDSYWSAAVRGRLVTDEQILRVLGRRTRLRVAEVLAPNPQACEQIPERIVRRYGVLPLSISETTLEVATGNPYDLDCEQILGFITGRRVSLVLAPPAQIAARLDEAYQPEKRVTQILAGVRTVYGVNSVDNDSEESTFRVADAPSSSGPLVQLVDHIVAEGIATRASDIHLEPENDGIAVRYRIDGVLRQMMVLPRGVGMPLVSRVKIMAKMDIADRLRPQGGRARVSVKGAQIDLRVSTLPAAHGEKVVIRILDASGPMQSLESLGLDDRVATDLRRLLDTREGLILVTGPTGSGKTTTLYAALQM
ncbi:MAG TPA: ATPase, T2SS/T4P/T4SS family, partial [Gemmatimonadaceae bacterium]|nr:ATPase, T2SS/T4P/T4SS family [Gemmatimonadaceae bacterium]